MRSVVIAIIVMVENIPQIVVRNATELAVLGEIETSIRSGYIARSVVRTRLSYHFVKNI